ncbi:MazG-like family protein [Streptomyces sp. NPDC002057]|uniref:MazG-like family protein n=1 Tax=Streptomyces sp. NPDC002057 TaxID=3154664 RepID=UPI00332B6A7C
MSGNDPWDTIRTLAALFDEHGTAQGLTSEEQWTIQVLKLSEEVGEAAQAVIGARATNPRKGRSHGWEHVQEEVADTVITGMVSLARMRPDDAPEFLASVLARKSARFLSGEGDEPAVTSR